MKKETITITITFDAGTNGTITNEILPLPTDVSIEEPPEVIEKEHAILSSQLIEHDVKSDINGFNGVHVKNVKEEPNERKTELEAFHVSGVIVERGKLVISCDIYARDIDKTESYLAYCLEDVGYTVYNSITKTHIGYYKGISELREFFIGRIKKLEEETIVTMYINNDVIKGGGNNDNN